MSRSRLHLSLLSLVLVPSALLSLGAFRPATMEVPAELSGTAEALAVTGHSPRTWNRPLAFGPYRTLSVREGTEFSWSARAFGLRGGEARKPYRLFLEGPDAAAWEVECRSRSIEVWRGSWSVELTDAFLPRLVCGMQRRDEPDGRPLRLILASTGTKLRGVVHLASESDAHPPLFSVRSVHRLEGSRLPLGEPAGYAIERDGVAVAAVETLNRGRVWLSPDLAPAERDRAAAVAAALLLYKPDLSPIPSS